MSHAVIGSAVDRLVHYSLCVRDERAREVLTWQFATSVQSLRAHNTDITVALFVHGTAPPEVIEVCRAFDVVPLDGGDYERRLQALCPTGSAALAQHPLLHKFLNFSGMELDRLSQILFCDVDTIFFRDVEEVFDAYGGADVVAREEVHSSRSHHGPDPSFIDEVLLRDLARHEGLAAIPPVNTGVVLFSRSAARSMALLERVFLDYAWRFLCWQALHPASGPVAAYGELDAALFARSLVGPTEEARALPFPSANRWLLDEAAFWLTLGHIRGLRVADFRRVDVAQGGEFDPHRWAVREPVLYHYFSQNTQRIHDWMVDRAALEGVRTQGGCHGSEKRTQPGWRGQEEHYQEGRQGQFVRAQASSSLGGE